MMGRTSEEVKSILEPLYEEMEQCYSGGHIDELVKFYHPSAIVIDIHRNTAYGRKAIEDVFQRYFDEYGPLTFEVNDVKWQGCEDYLIVHCECLLNSSKKGSRAVNLVAIWKNVNDRWLVYHEETSTSR